METPKHQDPSTALLSQLCLLQPIGRKPGTLKAVQNKILRKNAEKIPKSPGERVNTNDASYWVAKPVWLSSCRRAAELRSI
jgi:hypothetical protein